MSDPVTNVEIEDVLSSIRRLVLNEERPRKAQDGAPKGDGAEGATARAAEAQRAAQGAPEADKLVLTPFFRVDDHGQGSDSAPDEALVAAPASDPDPAKDAPDEALSASDSDSDLAQDKAADAGERSPEDPADDSPGWDDRAMETSGAEDAWDVEDAEYAEPAEDETDEAGDSQGRTAEPGEPSARMPDRRGALKARVAELEQVVAGRDDQWEPDGTTDDAYSGGPGAAVPWEDYSPDDDQSAPAAEEAAPAAEEAPEAETVAAPEAVPGMRQVKPPLDATDIPENFVAEEPRSGEEADSVGTMGDFMADGDDVLDEDALRDLVADIVRQELQGALGERITRNVRKLVRREIARALASQDLD